MSTTKTYILLAAMTALFAFIGFALGGAGGDGHRTDVCLWDKSFCILEF